MIRIVTDSVASIAKETLQEKNIQVVTLYVNYEGVEYPDATMDIDSFYEKIYDMVDNIPTSSQPSHAELEEVFRSAAEAGDQLIGVFLSEKYSGTIDGALRVARSVQAEHADFRYCIVDALSNSYDEGFAAIAAADARNSGASFDECVEAAKNAIVCSRFLFTPESLRFLKAGGRIGSAAALLGSIVKLCPVITVHDGDTEVFAKVRTYKKALATIADQFRKDVDEHGFKHAVVHYIGNPKTAIAWAHDFIEPICKQKISVLPVSPVIGLHVGPAVGIAYECNEPLPGKLTPEYEIPVYFS